MEAQSSPKHTPYTHGGTPHIYEWLSCLVEGERDDEAGDGGVVLAVGALHDRRGRKGKGGGGRGRGRGQGGRSPLAVLIRELATVP